MQTSDATFQRQLEVSFRPELRRGPCWGRLWR